MAIEKGEQMKKIDCIVFFIFLCIFTVFSQGFYFDIGVGLGKAQTEIDDIKVTASSSFYETGVNLGVKLGYGPFVNIPFYVVGDFRGIGHRYEYDATNYRQYNTYLVAPGIVFYPLPFIQIGSCIGYCFAADIEEQSSIQSCVLGSNGIGGNVSIAFDFGKKKNSCLLGVEYMLGSCTLKTNEIQKASVIDVFIRYAYRENKRSK